MDAEAYPRDDVKKFLGAMIVMKINPETSKEGKKVADQFDANSFPRLIVLTPKGDVLKEIKGSPQPDHFPGSYTNDYWNAMADAENAKPQDFKTMAKNVFLLEAWYPDTEAGVEASKLLARYKDNKEFTDSYNDLMKAHKREMAAAKADALLKLGKKKDAIEVYKSIVTDFDGTPEADAAKKALTKLGVKMDAPADPNKK